MHIFIPQIEIGDDEGFSKEKDIFNYSKSGESLTNLIQTVEDPMVIALDGPWGSGKTTFAKMWLGELHNEGFPAIHFDAFANDYMDDAFLAIAGEVISLAGEKTDKNSEKYKKFVAKAIDISKILGISSGKIVIKVLTLNAWVEGILKELWSMLLKIWNVIMPKCANVYLKSFLEKNKEKRSAIEDFKTALEGMVREFPPSDSGVRRPLVFVLDELDRCKPVFALELLEKIKHFFLVEGVVFVLVVNLEQLASSVKYSYGDGIEARTYLEKFYNVIFRLPEETGETGETGDHLRHKTSTFISYIFKQLSNGEPNDGLKDYIEDHLTVISIEKSFSLRTIEKIVTHIKLVLAADDDNELMREILIIGLCVLTIANPELYIEARNNTLTLDKIKEFFKFKDWDSKKEDWTRITWTYCLADELPEDGTEWGRVASDFGVPYHDRKTAIPKFCRVVDSFEPTKR